MSYELKQRLLSNIQKTESGCWDWTKSFRNGYGVLSLSGKNHSAHRLSYQVFKGNIPEGMLICHSCDNKKCINPDHLFIGSYSDNTKDAVLKGIIVVPKGKEFETGHLPKNSTLDKEKAQELKQFTLANPDMKCPEIAKMFEVKNQLVRDIRAGRTYINV